MIIFNEKILAEEIMNYGFGNKITIQKLSTVARYLKYCSKNLGQIRKELELLCFRFDPTFNLIISGYKLDVAIKSCKRNKLRMPENEIIITQKELDFLRGIGNYKKEKILFILLCCAKYFKYNRISNKTFDPKYADQFFVNAKTTEILKLAKVNMSKLERNNLFHEFHVFGYLNATYNGSYKLNYIDENSETVIRIGEEGINNLIDYYNPFCPECKKEFDKKSRKTDLCPECYKEKLKEQWRNNTKKYKLKNS